MITIYCALYVEAQELIRYYELKKDVQSRHFQVFFHEEKQIRVVITGVGKTNVSVAVAEISTIYPPGERDILINFGSCASGDELPAERVIMIHKLSDVESGRTFYPDMIYRHPFLEGEVETSSKVYTGAQTVPEQGATPQIVVYDMEAAALYEAANFYYGPHQMLFLKAVTDYGAGEAPDRETFARIMRSAGNAVAKFIDGVKATIDADVCAEHWTERSAVLTLWNDPALEGTGNAQEQPDHVHGGCTNRISDRSGDNAGDECRLAEDLHCSATMRAELAQLLLYWSLAGVDAKAVIDDYYEQGLLPCKDKRAGRRLLNELQNKWL